MDTVRRVAQEFSVKFDGEALAQNTMDVRALAPALLALGDAVQAVHRVLGEADDGQPAPALQIQATRGGSFDVGLLIDTLDSAPANAAANLAGYGAALWAVALGAMKVIKRFGRSEPPTPESRDGELVYKDPEGHVLIVPAGTDAVVRNGQFRAAISGFTRPLEEDGIDSITIDDGAPADHLEILREDRPHFAVQPAEELLDESTREARVHVETVQFRPEKGRKWRFSEESETFTATVEDLRFLREVRSGDRPVGEQDTLVVQMRETTYRRPAGGVRTDRAIVRVVDHRRAPIQDEFDFD